MSSDGEKVRFALKRALESINPKFSKVCYARNISANPITGVMLIDCESIQDGSVIEDVRLCANFNANSTTVGLLLVPKKDSVVIVSFIGDSEAFLSMVSEVDFVYLNANTFGGLVKIDPLIQKVNALENLLNNVLNTLKTTTIPLAASGSYPFAPLYAVLNNITPITQKSDLENKTVQHGNGSLV